MSSPILKLQPDHPRPSPISTALGIYIHIPFCVSKCSYCAFSSVTDRPSILQEYLGAVHREIDVYARSGVVTGRKASTIYFGGGTPSLVTPDGIAALIDHCDLAFGLDPEVEITLEANPETVSTEKLGGYRKAGVTRLSFGVQSFDERVLKDLGRVHTPARVRRAYDQARLAGHTNINLDLIYGLPHQTLEQWRRTVQIALELGPEHLSAYALTPEEGTPVGADVRDGVLVLPPDERVDADEALLHDALQTRGYVRYEISNYARDGFACRHNVGYWHSADWLGFGAAAHGHLGPRRWGNAFGLAAYLEGSQTNR